MTYKMSFKGRLARGMAREGFVRFDDGSYRKGDVRVNIEDDEAPEVRVTLFDHEYPDVVEWQALLSGAPAHVVVEMACTAARE